MQLKCEDPNCLLNLNLYGKIFYQAFRWLISIEMINLFSNIKMKYNWLKLKILTKYEIADAVDLRAE